MWLVHAWLYSSLCSNKLWTHTDTLRACFHLHSLQQLLESAHQVGAFFLWDEPLGREVGCAKLTCMALLIGAESEVAYGLGSLIHVCSVLSRWLGPEAVELEWVYAIWWLVQLGAHFPATQERLYKYRLKSLQFSLCSFQFRDSHSGKHN